MNRVLLLYVPVLHRGYLDVMERYRSLNRTCVLIGTSALDSLIKEPLDDQGESVSAPRAAIGYIRKKDLPIRGLDEAFVKAAIEATGWFGSVSILTQPDRRQTHLVAPDEDVTRLAAKGYFPNAIAEFIPVRLRYDRLGIERIDPIPDGLTVTTDEAHQALMGKAENAAAMSRDWWLQVGALIARDGQPLLTAYNQAALDPDWPAAMGDPRSCFSRGESPEVSIVLHAERGLVAQAARAGIALNGTDAYVTHFPCVTCAASLAQAGVRRVFFRHGFSRLGGADVLRADGVEIVQVV
jgi:dCMP deaminase